MTVSADMPLVGCVLTLLLLVLLIFMAAKGLRYQALMTSLNGVRFSFNCSMKGFWWVTFFLPILMAIGMGTVFFISTKMLHANSSSSVIISVVLMAIVGIVSIGIFNGTLYSLVMSFLEQYQFRYTSFQGEIRYYVLYKICHSRIFSFITFSRCCWLYYLRSNIKCV